MKIRVLFSLLVMCMTCTMYAQAPQGFQYQAVLRDGNGDPMLNKNVSFRFTIQDESGSQTYYQETQTTTSNALGGIILVIGAGNTTIGNFATADWKSGTTRVRVELDPGGGQNYSPFGITSFQSVPYALFAQQAHSLIDNNGNEWEPENDADEQTLTVNGNQLSISNGNAVTLPTGAGGGDNWGDQTIVTNATLTGEGTLSSPLKIASQGATNGEVLKYNGVTWAPGQDNGQLYIAGDGIGINGDVINNIGDDDSDPINEIQNLSINGNVLSLSNGGSVNLPQPNYIQGTGINIAGNMISAQNSQALWNANQLQSRSVASTAPSNGQVLKWDGSNWKPDTDNGQTYVGGTGISITGNSVSALNTQELWNANQLRSFNIADVTPSNGQILVYTPGGWSPQAQIPDLWTLVGNELYFTGNVGIGNANPEARLHISGGKFQIEDETIEKFGSNSMEFSCHIVPVLDNSRSLGLATRRFTEVFAVDGTINTSDRREKTNIKNLTYGLDDLMKLRPVSFSWISRPESGTKLGLIAQEVEMIMPEVVANPLRTPSLAHETEDAEGGDRLGLYYSDLIPVLIKSIQEQEEKIEQLQAEVATFRKKR